MTALLAVIHVLVCIALIVVVLLQTGKGAEIGATFGGGGSHTLFGSRGAGNFMTKATAVAGTIFMLTSLALAMMSTNITGGSIVEDTPAASAPAEMPEPAPMPMEGGTPFGAQPADQGEAPIAPAE